jgi:hypothetical protein
VYIFNMDDHAMNVLLDDAINRDRTTARRAALVEILLKERYLTREQLITRVEGKLGKGCFGDVAWEDTFFRDMQVVKQALKAAGYQPAYSRSSKKHGYYLRNRPAISADLSSVLDGCVAEVDKSQMEIFRKLTIAQRIQQGCSVSNLARNVVAHRIQQRKPDLGLAEAYRMAVRREEHYEW